MPAPLTHLADDEPELSALDPSTQTNAEVGDSGESTFSPQFVPSFGCMGCEAAGCGPKKIQGSELLCEGCIDSEDCWRGLETAAAAQLAARNVAAQQPRPVPPQLEPRRSERPRKVVVPIYDTDRSGKGQPGWSLYEANRAGARHGRTRDESYDELRANVECARRVNSDLSAQLDTIYGQLRSLSLQGTTAEDIQCEFGASVVLREAIIELVNDHERRETEAGHQPEETEAVHALLPWQPAQVRMGGVDGTLGELVISDSALVWTPINIGVVQLQLELANALFADVDEDDEDATLRCEASLRLTNGDVLHFYFNRTGSGLVQRAEFVRRVNAAAVEAQRQLDEQELSTPEPTAKKPRVEERVKQGAKLRALLSKVSKLRDRGKRDEARQMLQAADGGAAASKRTLRRRAGEMADLLFAAGGLETTRAVMEGLLSRSDVQDVLPAATAKMRAEANDAKTARSMLEAAKSFLHVLLDSKKRVDARWGGRRSDTDRNAFWASTTSLLPRDIFQSKGGRAAMRILEVPYRVIKQAATMRGKLEDRGKGWKLLKTAPRSDRVNGVLITEWWHSEDASTEDNVHKQPINVFHGFNDAGERQYETHWRRARIGNMRECLARFHASEQASKLREQTKRLKLPNGVTVGKTMLKKYQCSCVRVRGASECDDHLTTAAAVNLPKWHKARLSWHRDAKVKGVVCNCRMHVQARAGKPELLDSYLSMSKGIGQMEEALLPCGKVAWPAYQLPEEKPFKSFYGACCYGKCPKKAFDRASPFDASQPSVSACGWDSVFGADCSIECTDDPFQWLEWKQQLRGSDHDGQPTYAPELVPIRGTRRQFLAHQRSAICAALPHRYNKKVLRRGLKMHEALKTDATATVWSDYGAQMETDRLYTQTCARRERHNNCPSVVGFAPYVQTVKTKARGKRPASEVQIRKQRVFVIFGMYASPPQRQNCTCTCTKTNP